jgi:pantoate--beta-alanine ligase
MRLVKTIAEVKKIVRCQKKSGKTIGFVPTMGYLHEGHLSLVRIARRKAQFLIVSVFVNPAQFGPKEDLGRYPRSLKRDLKLLKKIGTDLVFYPSRKTMYPPQYDTYVKTEQLSKILCGVTRPHHFQGVTTIVLKLLNIVNPDLAVFGKKDFQQAVIIKRMVKDLNLDVKIITGKIIREKDGLAMSSRNIYLNPAERKNAPILYQSLKWVKKSYQEGLRNPHRAITRIKKMIRQKSGRIDYVETVDKETLRPVKKLRRGTLVALAVFFGRTRLIDNIVLQ